MNNFIKEFNKALAKFKKGIDKQRVRRARQEERKQKKELEKERKKVKRERKKVVNKQLSMLSERLKKNIAENKSIELVETKPLDLDLNTKYLNALEYLESNDFDTNEYRLNKYGVENILMSGKEKEFADRLEKVKSDIVQEADRIKSLLSENNQSRKTLEDRIGKMTDKEYVDFVDIVNTDIFDAMQEAGLIDSDQISNLVTFNVSVNEIKDYLNEYMEEYVFDGRFKDVDTDTFIDYVLTRMREQGDIE